MANIYKISLISTPDDYGVTLVQNGNFRLSGLARDLPQPGTNEVTRVRGIVIGRTPSIGIHTVPRIVFIGVESGNLGSGREPRDTLS